MGLLNNKKTSAQPSTSTQGDTLLAKLIGSLEYQDGLTYFNFISSQYGFSKAGRWSTLKTRINADIMSNDTNKIRCTTDTLEKVIDRVISQADHTYEIVELTPATATKVRKSILQINSGSATSQAAQLYPAKFDFQDNKTYPIGFSLCKITDLGDGHALIYSSVKMKRIHNRYNDYSQAFHTVFVPHSNDRVEYRVSLSLGKRYVNEEMKELKKSFVNDVNIRKGAVDQDPVNFFEAISDLFNDKSTGRVSSAKIATFEEKPHLSSNASSDPGYCCRAELSKHKKSVNNNDYHPWQISLQFKYSPSQDEEMEIALTPPRPDWNAKKCESITIKEPKNSLTLNNIISNIISRS